MKLANGANLSSPSTGVCYGTRHVRPVEWTNQHEIKLLSLPWANYGGTELDLLCKCLWACENQMTLFRQKFPVLGMKTVGGSARCLWVCGGQQRRAANNRSPALTAAPCCPSPPCAEMTLSVIYIHWNLIDFLALFLFNL